MRLQDETTKLHLIADLCEVVRHQPCDSLPLDVCLVVESLDGHKHFAQCMCPHNIGLELHGQPPGIGNHLGRDVMSRLSWQGGKEVSHGQGII